MITVDDITYLKVAMWCSSPEDAIKFAHQANKLIQRRWHIEEEHIVTFYRRNLGVRKALGIFSRDDGELSYLRDRPYKGFQEYLYDNKMWELKAVKRMYINGEVV